jgi:hypothetical protein
MFVQSINVLKEACKEEQEASVRAYSHAIPSKEG